MRMILPVLTCFLLSSGALSAQTESLGLWNAPLGTSYDQCLELWARQGLIPDLKADGPSFSRSALESLVFFRFKHFLGFLAQDIQAVFSQGKLTKVRMVFRKGQNPQGYFDGFFKEIKKNFDRVYFPSNRTLGFVKTGAAWFFPGGEKIYMGSIIPSDLVIILEQGAGGLFPRPE